LFVLKVAVMQEIFRRLQYQGCAKAADKVSVVLSDYPMSFWRLVSKPWRSTPPDVKRDTAEGGSQWHNCGVCLITR
jgi:hypothetical protein